MPPTAHRTVRTRDRTVPAPSNIQPTLGTPQSAWIPACAGMTEGVTAQEGATEGPRPERNSARCRPPHPAQQLAPLRLRDRLTYEPRTGQIPHQPRPPNRRAAARSSPRSHQAAPTRRDAAAPARPRRQASSAHPVPTRSPQARSIPISRRGICVLLSHPCTPLRHSCVPLLRHSCVPLLRHSCVPSAVIPA